MIKISNYLKKVKICVSVLFLFFVAHSNLCAQEIKFIKNPTPTHVEKNFIKLIKVGEISVEIDDEHFMAKPWFITVDNKGNIFVLDIMLKKIFKFDKNFKFIKTFGKNGQGPGEFGFGKGLMNQMYFSKDGYLYVSSSVNRKIIQFDTDGNHKRDIKFPNSTHTNIGFVPLVDSTGNYYILNRMNYGIDIYSRDKKKLYTLLTKDDYNRSLILQIRKKDYMFWSLPDIMNTYYDIIPNNRLIVYLSNSSTLYIFEKDRLIKKFDIWPKKALEVYKRRIDKKLKKLKKNDFLIHMFFNFFIDKDNENYFYLDGFGDKKRLLYKFDLKGDIVNIFYPPFVVNFLAKRNNLFFGIHKDNIYIFKEDKDDKKSH